MKDMLKAREALGTNAAVRRPVARGAVRMRAALSILLSLLLVVTMNPLANDAEALAYAADAVQNALVAPTKEDSAPVDQPSGGESERAGGGLSMR